MRKILVGLFAGVLAVTLAACGGQGTEPEPAGSEQAAGMVVSNVGIATKIEAAAPVSDTAEFTVTVNEGESLVVLSDIAIPEEGLPEDDYLIKVSYSQDGADMGEDEGYGGQSYTSLGFDPGEYVVTVEFNNASGTVYVLSYDDSDIDVMEMDTDQIFEIIMGSIEG